MDEKTRQAYLEYFTNEKLKDFEGDLELPEMLNILKSGSHYKDTQLVGKEFSSNTLKAKRRTMNYKLPYLAEKQEYYYQAYQYVHKYNFTESLDRYICTAYSLGLTHKQISKRIKSIHGRLGIWKPYSRSSVQRRVAWYNRKLRLFLYIQSKGGLVEVKAG